MQRAITTSADVQALLQATIDHGAVLVTGPHGIGKSHVLRALAEAAPTRDLTPVAVMGSPASQQVPLAGFAGALPDMASSQNASEVIATLTRRRSRSILIVDAVDLLDDTSVLVVGHLVRAAKMTAVLSARSLDDCPAELRALYDAGHVVETALQPLSDAALSKAIQGWLKGSLTPGTLRDILHAAAGNPLVARELVTGSLASGALRETAHGWELEGPVAATTQLSRIMGAHVESLSDDAVDALALVALAGSLPSSAIRTEDRRALTRAGLVTREADGWLTADQPLLTTVTQAQVSDAHWQALAHDACTLLNEAARDHPYRAAELTRRASVIALDHNLPLTSGRATALATHALVNSDFALALRAADAALMGIDGDTGSAPSPVEALRIRGLASSALGMGDSAYENLLKARQAAHTDPEVGAVSLALASHIGLSELNPQGALEVIERAKREVTSDEWLGHLDRAAFRWAAVSGQQGPHAHAPGEVTDAEAAMGLAIMATSAVVTGPLDHAFALEARFRALPDAVLSEAPSAVGLMQLASIMALSYTGDIQATRRELQSQIDVSRRQAPEVSGAWEYALGVVELFAADAQTAYNLANAAVEHLHWRDPFGLLPAAVALRTAAGHAAGLALEHASVHQAPSEELGPDPKVIVLTVWANAWSAAAERKPAQAETILLDGAQAMLTAQHTFFAAKLAHCAVRVGGANDRAVSLLEQAHAIAGGGLLTLMLEHARASLNADATLLDAIAQDMMELGMVATAADTWLALAQNATRRGVREAAARRWAAQLSAVRAQHPDMALWQPAGASTALLTRREYEVAALAAQRLTAKEIAAARGVSPHTVNNQLQSVFTKLGISGRTELREVWDDLALASLSNLL